jgi:hypothetical protein
VIDPDHDNIAPLPGAVVGVGTEAHTLLEAGVESAVGIIAGTDSDTDNLSIIMTARELNPKLTTVVRQNLHQNALVFRHSRCDYVMEPGRIIANRILAQLKTPLLSVFLQHLQQETDVWAHQLLNRMSNTVGDDELDSWAIRIDPEQTPAVISMLEQGRKVTLRMLYRNPRQRDRMLPAFALLLRNADGVRILPGELTELQPGDELLCCGLDNVLRQMEWTVNNYNVLYYVITGEDPPHSLLARLLRRQEQESL